MANTHFSLNHGTDKEYYTNYLNTKYISDNIWMKILYKKWGKKIAFIPMVYVQMYLKSL